MVEDDHIMDQISRKISIFEVISQPVGLKIHPNVGLFSPKSMPKHLLDYTKTNLKKSKDRLFWAQNCQKMGGNIGEKVNF